MSIYFTQFYNPYQPETPFEIKPGASGVIYEFELPPEFVGFIYKLASAWYANTYIDWEIDGNLIERLKRKIGDIKDPEVFNPPIFVREKIKFTAYNDDSASHSFWVLCDGLLRRKIM